MRQQDLNLLRHITSRPNDMHYLDRLPLAFPSTPAAVIVDLDGLLLDTKTLCGRTIAASAAEGGRDLREANRLMIGRPLNQSRVLLKELYGQAFRVEEFGACQRSC